MTVLDCAGRRLDLADPVVMGILNVTPDSFSDGGLFLARDRAVRQAVAMAQEGAAIIDIGGESTRPGAQPVSVQEEMDRVIPVIEAVHATVPLPLSIDTSKPEVMRAAAAAGAGLINDVYALCAEGALETVHALGAPVCLMHMRGEPRTMQQNPVYTDVITEVRDFLRSRIDACVAAGIARERIIVDPGFGFGKTLEHNLQLLRRLADFKALGAPILVGLSRKSFIAAALALPVDQRLYPSLALGLLAVQNGANIVRTHDVRPMVEVIRMYQAVYPNGGSRDG